MVRTAGSSERRPRWWWGWRLAGFLVFVAALAVTNLFWDGPLAAELAVLAVGGTVQVTCIAATEHRFKQGQRVRRGGLR